MPTPSHWPMSSSSSTRDRVAVLGQLGDQRAGDLARIATGRAEQAVRDRRVRPRQLAGLADQRVAGGVLLPAAAVAALAAVAARHDLHVPELAGDAELAALQLAVDSIAPPMPVPR